MSSATGPKTSILIATALIALFIGLAVSYVYFSSTYSREEIVNPGSKPAAVNQSKPLPEQVAPSPKPIQPEPPPKEQPKPAPQFIPPLIELPLPRLPAAPPPIQPAPQPAPVPAPVVPNPQPAPQQPPERKPVAVPTWNLTGPVSLIVEVANKGPSLPFRYPQFKPPLHIQAVITEDMLLSHPALWIAINQSNSYINKTTSCGRLIQPLLFNPKPLFDPSGCRGEDVKWGQIQLPLSYLDDFKTLLNTTFNDKFSSVWHTTSNDKFYTVWQLHHTSIFKYGNRTYFASLRTEWDLQNATAILRHADITDGNETIPRAMIDYVFSEGRNREIQEAIKSSKQGAVNFNFDLTVREKSNEFSEIFNSPFDYYVVKTADKPSLNSEKGELNRIITFQFIYNDIRYVLEISSFWKIPPPR